MSTQRFGRGWSRRAWLQAHRWVALSLGLLILVQSASGAVVAYRRELGRILEGSAVTAAPGSAASLERVADAVSAAAPGVSKWRLDVPERPSDTYLTRFELNGQDWIASVDPSTAQVRKLAPLWRWPVEFVFSLHQKLCAGDLGEYVVGLTGFGLLFLALSGPWIWWPGLGGLSRAARVRRNSLWSMTRDLHRLGGVLVCGLVVLIAATGVGLAWRGWIRPLLPPAPTRFGAAATQAPCAAHSLDAAVDLARRIFPHDRLWSLRLDPKVVRVGFHANLPRPRAQDVVVVDRCRLRVLGTERADAAVGVDLVYAWLLPLHSGQAGGAAGRLLAEGVALSVCSLTLSGLALWIRRQSAGWLSQP